MAGTKYLPMSPGTYAGVNSNFRTRERPNHNGVDMAAAFNVPIYSVSDGTVAFVGINNDPQGYGSWIVIDSQDQWKLDFTYGHMPPKSLVNPRTGEQWKYGDRVFAGDQIAVVGSEGGSTGPHLHFECSGPPGRFGGEWLDPAKVWIEGAEDPRKAKAPSTNPVPAPTNPAPAPTKPPQGSYIGKELLDYSAGVPTADEVANAGFVGAIRYTAPAREEWMGGKPLGKAEADALRARGLFVVSNYQFAKGGNETSDWLRGRAGGVADSETGLRCHKEAGGPDDAPIYVSVDANPGDANLRDKVLPYLTAWQERIGRERLGVYGNRQTIQFCIDNGIGSFFWQHGWDGRKKGLPIDVHPDAHLLQYQIDTTVPGVKIGVDKNRILKDSFGAWGQGLGATYNPPATPAPSTPVGAPAVKSPGGYQVTNYSAAPQPGFTRGHKEYLRIYVHTTENQDWITKAENVAAYQGRQQDGSYHDLIDDTHILQTVHRDNTAWGVLADNAVSLQLALVCTSGAVGQWSGPNPNVESRPKTREQWLEHADMLDMLAWRIQDHARAKGIPMDRVTIEGVGRNQRGVSSHNNYTYGSKALRGFKDGTHWDVPDTFPFDVVLATAYAYAGQPFTPPPPPDPNEYPLRWGNGIEERYGPLEGGAEDISNRWGNPTAKQVDGLKRWQKAIGIPESGIYDEATKQAALKLQQIMGWPTKLGNGEDNGRVWLGEWNVVIKDGYRFPANVDAVVPALPARPEYSHYAINPGVGVTKTRKIKDLTGTPDTHRFGLGGTDLGIFCRTPKRGLILAVFGDSFELNQVGGPGWRSPVALFSKTQNLDEGIVWDHAAGGDPNYARQLWDYEHNNPVFSTVLPTDVIVVGDVIYLHVMVCKGLGNVQWTEIWKSVDDGETWQHTGAKFAPDIHHGLAQMQTWATDGSGWVYVMSTGFQRDKPLILRRVHADKIADPGAYEGWGWKDGSWNWGNPPTPVLENASSAGKFGEMSLEYIQGQWVLVTFDTSNVGGYDIDIRVFKNITDNLYTAKKSTPIRGANWGMEGDDAVAQLYGPSIIPGSTVDAGFHMAVSQWNTGAPNGWPYKAMQFKVPISPVVPPTKAPTPPIVIDADADTPAEEPYEETEPAPAPPKPSLPTPPPASTNLPPMAPPPPVTGMWKSFVSLFARLFSRSHATQDRTNLRGKR